MCLVGLMNFKTNLCGEETHISKKRFVYFKYMYTIWSLYDSVIFFFCKTGEIKVDKTNHAKQTLNITCPSFLYASKNVCVVLHQQHEHVMEPTIRIKSHTNELTK